MADYKGEAEDNLESKFICQGATCEMISLLQIYHYIIGIFHY